MKSIRFVSPAPAMALLFAACASAKTQTPGSAATPAAVPAPASPIAAKTLGLERRDGFIPLYLDSK
jgi:hypothetical protein